MELSNGGIVAAPTAFGDGKELALLTHHRLRTCLSLLNSPDDLHTKWNFHDIVRRRLGAHMETRALSLLTLLGWS